MRRLSNELFLCAGMFCGWESASARVMSAKGLGIADLLAVLYFGEMKYDANNLAWSDRDRFLLSIGHYSIGLYAALAEAGVITVMNLIPTARTNRDSRWPAAKLRRDLK